MALSAQDIITLAQNTKALSKEQVARILEVAPQMGPADLEKLRAMILKVQAVQLEEMKKNLAVYQKANAAYSEWKADKNRADLKNQEGSVKRADLAQAETLIHNIEQS